MFHPVLNVGVTQPFMLVGRPNHTAEDPTWDTFWDQLAARGTRRAQLEVGKTQHGSFTDVPALLTAVNISSSVGGQQGEILREQFGAVNWSRMQEIVLKVVVGFLQFGLDGETVVAPVLTKDGDPTLPEVHLVRGDL